MAILLDGFDLVVFGVVLPPLLDDKAWGLTPATGALAATIGLVGMTIGAVTIGMITDVIGRRKALLIAVTAFSLFTLLCVFSPNAWVLGLFRFLAGLGLGGCLPTAIALATEFAHKETGRRATTLLMTGYHVGAVLIALLGILWATVSAGAGCSSRRRARPAAGALMYRLLPESPIFLRARRPQTPTKPGTERATRHRRPVPERPRPLHAWRSGSPRSWACCWLRPEHLAAADHA